MSPIDPENRRQIPQNHAKLVGVSFKISGDHLNYLRQRAIFQSTPEHKVTASEILRMIIDTDKMAFEMVMKKLAEGTNATETPKQLSLAISANN